MYRLEIVCSLTPSAPYGFSCLRLLEQDMEQASSLPSQALQEHHTLETGPVHLPTSISARESAWSRLAIALPFVAWMNHSEEKRDNNGTAPR